MRLIKMVRDHVDKISDQKRIIYLPFVTQEERTEELRKKLVEEVVEYLTANSQTKRELELADIWEVLCQLAEYDGTHVSAIEDIARKKRYERGGFSIGTGMYAVNDDEYEEINGSR